MLLYQRTNPVHLISCFLKVMKKMRHLQVDMAFREGKRADSTSYHALENAENCSRKHGIHLKLQDIGLRITLQTIMWIRIDKMLK